ncbi:hypothetical protein FXN80_16185 [Dickeya fangzhongdai]|nr:hypothetical protein [Dickeya fangzhongdai]UMB75636.1 hypothetical protein FXN80_16185 [Dickeya fangzhongdai]
MNSRYMPVHRFPKLWNIGVLIKLVGNSIRGIRVFQIASRTAAAILVVIKRDSHGRVWRTGHHNRSGSFTACGMAIIRDFRMHSEINRSQIAGIEARCGTEGTTGNDGGENVNGGRSGLADGINHQK